MKLDKGDGYSGIDSEWRWEEKHKWQVFGQGVQPGKGVQPSRLSSL